MGRKPLMAIAGAVLAGVTLSGCESGRPYYDGSHSYLPSQGYRGPYAQNGMMYSQPQMVAGAVPTNAPTAMTMKPAPTDGTPAIQLASNSVSAGTTPMLTITMPAVRFQVPLTGAITYSQTPGTMPAAPVSTEQLPGALAAPDGQVMQALSPHVPATAPYPPPPAPFTTPAVQSTNYAAPAAALVPSASYPAAPAPVVPGQGAMGSSPAPSSPVQYLPPVSPAPRADAAQLSAEMPPPAWPKAPGEGVEETTAPPVPPPIHRGPGQGTTPARPTLYYQ